jgi:hypothetical protein
MTFLTATRLKELLSYDPGAGWFVWSGRRRAGVSLGSVCGRISRHGYREIRVDGVLHRANRLAWLYMTGEWPARVVDHINRNKADDSWSNLRLATNSENAANQCVRKSNVSGFVGVSWCADRQKWAAQIRIAGRKTNLGRFATAEEAAKAYDRAAFATFGGFANLNFDNPDASGVSPPSGKP